MVAVAMIAVAYWGTAPSKDQVCRERTTPIFDAWHGVDGQPTCQQLFDQLDAQAAESRSKNEELKGRISELESRLNM